MFSCTIIISYVFFAKKKSWLDSIRFWKFGIFLSFMLILGGFYLKEGDEGLLFLGLGEAVIIILIAFKRIDSLKKGIKWNF
jgi:hypothetical protein